MAKEPTRPGPVPPTEAQPVVVVQRAELDHDAQATTPAGMPNVWLVVMPAATVVLVRVLRTYFQSVLGFATAALVAPIVPVLSDVLPPNELGEIVVACFLAGLGPAFIALLQNVVELLAKVDEKLPQVRA